MPFLTDHYPGIQHQPQLRSRKGKAWGQGTVFGVWKTGGQQLGVGGGFKMILVIFTRI